MATIGTDPNGHRRILFVADDGSRKTVRLGKMSERTAESIRLRIEELASCKMNGQPISRDTSAWLADIGNVLHDRLARVGLVTSRADITATKLGAFIDGYIDGRVDAKPRTIINLKQARKAMVSYFGADKPLVAITPGDADAFRLKMLGQKFAEATVRRVCGRARQFFRAAIRRELVHRNPFDGIKCAVSGNPDRLFYVTRTMAQKVLDACPDAEWRLIFALCRYGGVRCPSELAMRWGDVDWEHNRLTVHSPKTEHYEGKGTRLIPLFPELRPYLLAAFEQAPEGAEFVIPRCRDSNVNLRSRMEWIIKRAGLTPWPKMFHNLRATRETELTQSFPLHVVCAWIGNTQAIAAKHYLQVRDEDFDRAAAGNDSAAQNPAQQAHADDSNGPQEREAEKSQNEELQAVAANRDDLQSPTDTPKGSRTPVSRMRT